MEALSACTLVLSCDGVFSDNTVLVNAVIGALKISAAGSPILAAEMESKSI